MQHNLVRQLLVVVLVAFAPVVADGIREDISCSAESCGGDAAAHGWVSLETMLGVLIPEVEGAVGTGGRESGVNWMPGDGIDGVDISYVVGGSVAVALEREVGAVQVILVSVQ